MTSGEVRAKARRYDTESVLVYRVTLGLTPLFLAAFIYNIVRLREQPLLMAGSALGLVAFCCMAWKLVRNGPHRITPAEPCLDFLRREFEAKRRGPVSTRLSAVVDPSGNWRRGGEAGRRSGRRHWEFSLHGC